jgi:hypothetical protein
MWRATTEHHDGLFTHAHDAWSRIRRSIVGGRRSSLQADDPRAPLAQRRSMPAPSSAARLR